MGAASALLQRMMCHVLFIAILVTASPLVTAHADGPPTWPFFGNDLSNSRGHISNGYSVGAANQINPRTAPSLALKWSYTTVGDVSATPTVEAGGLYFPDYAGYLYKLDPATGSLIWSATLASYLGGTYGYSRSSPAIGALGEIVIGDNSTHPNGAPGARLLSINKSNGALNWAAIVDPYPNAFITSSPVIYGGRIYVGVASLDEALASSTPGFTPAFRGSVVALDEATGTILWQFWTVPPGYTGAAVWGSSPVVWTVNHALLATTGNNYSVPTSVAQCYASAGADAGAQYACMDPTNYVDSVLSLDLTSGRLLWSRRFAGADTWTLACARGPASACQSPAGADNDFGSAPNMAWITSFVGVPDDRGGTSKNYLLGAGEKNGMYWALNPANGGLFWSSYVGRGQILWGSAVNTNDHNLIYVALNNSAHYANTLAGVKGVPVTWTGGAWAALNILSGSFAWQVPTYGYDLANPQKGGAAPGPVTFTNRVLFGGSTSGYFVALDATSGRTLWTYNAGGSILGGPSVYNETLFWGAGATKSGPGSVHTMFAFAVPTP